MRFGHHIYMRSTVAGLFPIQLMRLGDIGFGVRIGRRVWWLAR